MLKKFINIEITVLFALLICAFSVAIFSAAQASYSPTSMFSPIESGKMVFLSTLLIGILPALAFGAPIYFALTHYRKANWATVLIAGSLPGLFILFFSTELGLICLAAGVVIAAITHSVWRSRL